MHIAVWSFRPKKDSGLYSTVSQPQFAKDHLCDFVYNPQRLITFLLHNFNWIYSFLFKFIYRENTPVVQHKTNLPAKEGDEGSIPGLGRSPGKENGNPLQYSYLENPMDRGAWQATVYGVPKSQTRLRDWERIHKLLIHKFTFYGIDSKGCF